MKIRAAFTCVAAIGLIGAAPPRATSLPPLRVLITNDDGVSSEGIAALVSALRPVADVVVAAPAENNSGGSQSVTIFSQALQVDTLPSSDGVTRYAVHGTPADSVIFGLLDPGKQRPFDLVISGINKGENVGEAVYASGTVGAARQAVLMGVPAIAVSQQYRVGGVYDFGVAAGYTVRVAQQLHRMGRAAPRLVSINVPTVAKGVRLVPAGGSPFELTGMRKIGDKGPGSATYRVGLAMTSSAPAGTDTAAVKDGYIAVTVLSTDPNDRAALARLSRLPAIRSLPAR